MMNSRLLKLLFCSQLIVNSIWPGNAMAAQTEATTQKKETTMSHITGSFEVKLTPQTVALGTESAKLGRMSIDKEFSGELQAHSVGEMLASRSAVPGSAGYVAMERVTGSLQGKKGSFVLMHIGSMQGTTSTLKIEVVPDSGTDELTGLSGEMQIEIKDGQHFYRFDFSRPES